MRETFTSGSVGRAPGNRCLYPEADCLQRPLLRRSRFRQRLSASVRLHAYGKQKVGIQAMQGEDYVVPYR